MLHVREVLRSCVIWSSFPDWPWFYSKMVQDARAQDWTERGAVPTGKGVSKYFWNILFSSLSVQGQLHRVHVVKFLAVVIVKEGHRNLLKLVNIWCSSRSINIFFQASLKNSSLQICIWLIPPYPTCVYVCVCVCVCAISHCTFLHLQYIYLYHTCVLKSEFGHVWLLTTLVYLLKLLYVNSCMVGSHMAWNLFLFCPLYVFIHFL